MAEHSFDIGVIVARKKLNSPWADHVWLPHAVLPAVPAAKPWTSLGMSGELHLFYAGSCEVALHSAQSAYYRDNLASGRPSLWVSLQTSGNDCAVLRVTADPYEGEALTEAIGGLVEAVPMPQQIQARIAEFVATFHVERPFIKRERDRADPDALGRRRPVPDTDMRKWHER